METVYIPTRARGPSRQITFGKIAPALRGDFHIRIVCPTEERSAFVSAGYDTISHSQTNLGDTRQWIVEQHTGSDAVVMVDDDFNSWSFRPDPAVGRYEKAKDADILRGFQALFQNLQFHANAGIGPRLFANAREATEYCTRVNGVVGYRKDILQRHGLTFCPLPEDLEMTIQLMRCGYSSVTDFKLVYDQMKSNAVGGCSTYRTLEYHNFHQNRMHRWHKDYTRLVRKTTKDGWFAGQPRIENVISWAKLINRHSPATINMRVGPENCKSRDTDEKSI